ncbi:MAG: GNAT family N-acetyltransferase [Phycisphaerales bacterium]|nr:GNAT family N-acetyltransferase [Phycisphaerales bacterium]
MPPATPLAESQLDTALAILLAPANGRQVAPRSAVRQFRDHIQASGAAWEGLGVWDGGALRAALLALLPPGRTAVILVPPTTLSTIDADAQRNLTHAAVATLSARDLHFVQALIEPGDDDRRALLAHGGLAPLTTLAYLERIAVFPWTDSPPQHFTWLSYNSHTHDEFERVVAESYVDSLDCPELAGLRPIADVLAGHRAAGPFDPALWSLARVAGEPVGCLLLTRIARGEIIEIVYVGVVPAWRRRGVGAALIQRAIEQARTLRVRRVTVAADARNTPAQQLYERFAFAPIGRREVLWRRVATVDG